MVKEFNIVITGVGGQGVILVSEFLGNAAVKDGLDVRGSETLGMAVRGGSVFSTIRLGSEVYGPLTPAGKCDLLIAMELAEALRNVACLSKSSLVILNTATVVPSTVLLGQSDYPSLKQVVEKLNEIAGRVVVVNATQIAKEAGSTLSTNIAMLGAAFGSGLIPIKVETVKEMMQVRFLGEAASVNNKAFDIGYQACQPAM